MAKLQDIRVRATQEEKDEYKKIADILGYKNLSDLIRACLNEKKDMVERMVNK